jgi:hypothetical protein
MRIRRRASLLALSAAAAAFAGLGVGAGPAQAETGFTINGFGTGQCLVSDASNSFVQVTTCNQQAPNQQWKVLPNIGSGLITVENIGTQKCMGVDNNLNRASILLVPCDLGKVAQGWQKITTSQTGFVMLKSGFGGNKCLDRPTEFTRDFEPMQLWDCSDPHDSIFHSTHDEQRMRFGS